MDLEEEEVEEATGLVLVLESSESLAVSLVASLLAPVAELEVVPLDDCFAWSAFENGC